MTENISNREAKKDTRMTFMPVVNESEEYEGKDLSALLGRFIAMPNTLRRAFTHTADTSSQIEKVKKA